MNVQKYTIIISCQVFNMEIHVFIQIVETVNNDM